MKPLSKYIHEKLIVNKNYKTTYDDNEVLRIFKDEIATSDAKQKYFNDNYSSTWKSDMPSALWITVRNDFLSHPYSYQLNNNDAETLFKYLVKFDAIYEFRFNSKVYSSNSNKLINLCDAASDIKKPDEAYVKNVNIKAFKFDDIAIVKASDKTNGESRVFVAINIKSLHEKLMVNKDYSDVHTCSPETWDELRKIIEQRYEELGSGTKQNPIDFNDIDVSNIDSFYNEDMNGGVFTKTKFEYIDVSRWDVSNAKNMNSMFHNCENLKSVGDLSNWDVSSVKDMRFMFLWCTKLTSIGDLSDWDVSNVEKMNGMFYACDHLKSIGDLSNWNVSNVYSNACMFKYSGIKNTPDWYKE